MIVTKKGEDDPMLDEAPIPYEEIEIDEANPADGRYDPEVSICCFGLLLLWCY